MSTTSDKLAKILAEDATIAALVADRIFVQVAPPSPQQPFIVYRLVSNKPLVASEGKVGDGPATYQVDSVGIDDAGSEALADAVETALDGATTLDCSPDMRRSVYEEGHTGSEDGIFAYRQNFVVWDE